MYYEYGTQDFGRMQEDTTEQGIYNRAFVYPQNMNNALLLILDAISGENEDRLFYSYLIDNAPSEEDRQMIDGIRSDEIGHFRLFDQLFHELTGMEVPQVQGEEFNIPASYCEGLRNALIGEQNAVRKYRNILYALQNRIHINMLTEIITDEIRHGILYSYLYSKNACNV